MDYFLLKIKIFALKHSELWNFIKCFFIISITLVMVCTDFKKYFEYFSTSIKSEERTELQRIEKLLASNNKIDQENGFYQLESLSRTGSDIAKLRLVKLYFMDSLGKKDLYEAKKIILALHDPFSEEAINLRKMIDAEMSSADYSLNEIYKITEGCDSNLFQRPPWLRNSGENMALALMYLYCPGIEKNPVQAETILLEMITTNDVASYILGRLYHEGTDLAFDPVTGRELIEHACHNNYFPACDFLAQLPSQDKTRSKKGNYATPELRDIKERLTRLSE